FLELEQLAAHVHGDRAGQVAACHGGGNFRDVAHLCGEVGGHGIDVVCEVFPRAGHARNVRLAAELAGGAYFARDAAHFRGKCVPLLHALAVCFFELEHLAADVGGDCAGQVAACHGDGHLRDIAHLCGEVGGHGIYIVRQVL